MGPRHRRRLRLLERAVHLRDRSGANYAFGVYWVATDGSDVYWAKQTELYKCSRNGCNNAPALLATLQNSAFVVALDATDVYFGVDAQKAIFKTPKSGGAPTKVADVAGNVRAMVIESGLLVATLEDGSVIKVSTAGGAPTLLAPTGPKTALGLALGGGFAYFTIFSDPGTVNVTNINNGNATPIALSQRLPFGIAVDQTDVYWVSTVTPGPLGELWSCSIAMCNPKQ